MKSYVRDYVSMGERVVLTLWVGGMWAVGYVVLPAIFHFLDDRRLAGEIAGQILKVSNSVGLVCGLLVLINAMVVAGSACLRSSRVWVIAIMLALIAIILFVLQPMLFEIKQQAYQAGNVPGPRFGQLHAASSIAYLIASVLGLILVGRGHGKK